MISKIYFDNLIEFLKHNLGEPVKVTSKNIICRCPWCEIETRKKHYHLSISLENPIFHCFYAGCNKSGTINKLITKIAGKDITEKYVDIEKIKEFSKKLNNSSIKQNIINIPEIDIQKFYLKYLYLKSRFKYCNSIKIENINGLVFDIKKFFSINSQIKIDNNNLRYLDYYQSNFIGFLTVKNSILILRNIVENSKFRYCKIKLYNTKYLDYYKIVGNDPNSNTIILSEGIFDIYSEYLFNFLSLKNSIRLYASALSTSYKELIKSIVMDELIFKLNIVILSDIDVKYEYYKKLKENYYYIIDSMTIYYNKMGKDFNCVPVDLEKIKI